MKQFPLQTALTIATLVLLLSAARLVTPSIHGPEISQVSELVEFSPERTPVSPLVKHVEPAPPPPPMRPAVQVPSPLLDDSNHGLDHFYQSLGRSAVTRVVHFGDSPTTADLVTGELRHLLQKQYGDAGHGFVLIAKPWAWYQHQGVQLAGSGWQDVPASRFEARDGMFGLGGVSFTGSKGASSTITLESAHSRFEVWYLRQPNGGVVDVSAGGVPLGSIDTAGETKEAGFASFPVEGGASELALRVERGAVRLFGVTAEKGGPGVVYDSLGLNGASVTVLSRMFSQAHLAAELRHRNPDLVVLNYGTNEADFPAFVDKQYESELRAAIGRIEAALPDASVLVMSPMDRGQRAAGGAVETMATIPRIVAIQRRVALDTGCGFFDTFAAMGGEGTMARWYAAQPRLVSADFIHPYPAGGKIIAAIVARELSAGMARYQQRTVSTENGGTLK